MDTVLNGTKINIYRHNARALRLPLSFAEYDYYLAPDTTMADLCKAANIGTYDYALPQEFWDKFYAKFGRVPRGVWLYPNGSIFGRFCSMEEILERLADQIVATERPPHYFDEWGNWRAKEE